MSNKRRSDPKNWRKIGKQKKIKNKKNWQKKEERKLKTNKQDDLESMLKNYNNSVT